jgi:hypothetical protein
VPPSCPPPLTGKKREALKAKAKGLAPLTAEPSVSVDLVWPPLLLSGCHTSITCYLRANLVWLALYTNLQTVKVSKQPLHMNASGTCEGRTVARQTVSPVLSFDLAAGDEAEDYTLR